MNLDPASSGFLFTIKGCDRWQVYRRLCELEISCSCAAHQPLIVHIESTIALVQLWSVMRQAIIPRQVLVDWLEDCWKCRF
ncbi:hypothetical protein H6F51_11895 [Cyanobacteria bacterium FACHB-DQ100]|uniref:Asr1405/Asl0597 family protein n=1 Tax=Leptolyngbya sp. DQ-M1 TaxID=2933920 RepID=UPI0019CA26C3|nr:hypothetical protein [Cyanobacteria bacterium FACHB-DQ100]